MKSGDKKSRREGGTGRKGGREREEREGREGGNDRERQRERMSEARIKQVLLYH